MKKQKIGIMDSGVGGLTVEREIAKEFPGNDILYIGDTARVPYGGRTVETIKQFSLELLNILLSKNVSVVVVACNTISATCLDFLQSKSPVPVIGVIDPTVEEVLKSKIKSVGIIGTKATIKSNIYANKLKNLKTISIACPLFVPIVEENFIDNPATKIIIKTYLGPLKNNINGLILGCTHYPYLLKQLKSFLGPIKYFESGKATASALRSIINREVGKGKREYIFTDEFKK
ncbi:MAG: glutamate racemase [bacterium]|nr:glutamate racemase [bacterium]